jgi:hypothetical protein
MTPVTVVFDPNERHQKRLHFHAPIENLPTLQAGSQSHGSDMVLLQADAEPRCVISPYNSLLSESLQLRPQTDGRRAASAGDPAVIQIKRRWLRPRIDPSY